MNLISRSLVIVPTFNAAQHLPSLIAALSAQGLQPSQILFVDSSSSDETAKICRSFGANVVVIPQSQFNHGGTRRFAADWGSVYEFLIYLTQDALPVGSTSLANLLSAFSDPSVGLAYGRQQPRPEANPIERHARLRNYPESSEIRSLDDRIQYGVKTTFCSDSFAAYRRDALAAVGGFPPDTLFAEDQIVAGRMLLAGWKIAYVATASVIHSHDYTVTQDFKRYFDAGVFHARNKWLLDSFGHAEGEGLRFVRSELRYLWEHGPLLIPSALIRTLAKYIGYRLGRIEQKLSTRTKRKISMAAYYWRDKDSA